MLHRYVMFSIGPRYLLMHPKRAGSEITLDVALPRNAEDWDKVYPDAVEGDVFLHLNGGAFFVPCLPLESIASPRTRYCGCAREDPAVV